VKRHFVLTLFVLYFFAVHLAAANGLTVSGRVLDPSGQPVPHAKVRLLQSAGADSSTTYTGGNGSYSFNEIAPGDYLLDASSTGLSVARPVAITLMSNSSETIDLKLIVSVQRSQVTVTAANSPQSIDLVSKALDVVNVEQAERRGIFSVPDSLAQVPGLRITTRGGPGSLTTIQTRGLRATDTAVLIDGFRLRDNTAIQGDATAFLSDLFLVDSSQIEVLRGSGSSLYGTNSMGGTINIITDQGGGPVHGDFDYQSGGLGLNRGLARVAGGALHDRLLYSAGIANLNEINGVNDGGAARNWSAQGGISYSVLPTLRIGGRVFADTDYLQFQVIPTPGTIPDTTYVNAIPPSPSQLALANRGLPYDATGATFIPNLNDPDARRNGHFASGLFYAEQQLTPRWSWRVNYQSVGTHRDNIDGPGGPGIFQPAFRTTDQYDGRVDTVQARTDFIANPWQTLTAGYEFEYERYRNFATDANPNVAQRPYYFIDEAQKTNAAFAQDQMRLFSGRLLVLLSGRFQNFQLDKPYFLGADSPYPGIRLPSPPNAFTGDTSVAYFVHKSSTKIRAHGGNGFREPSLYERFGSYFYGNAFTAIGDPRLSPERSVSMDAGIDQYLWGQRLKLSGTFFYTRLQQVISYDTLGIITPATDPYGRFGGYFNTGGGLAHGVELNGEFRPARSTLVQASYTYTNAIDRTSQFATGTAINPIQTPRIIPHTFTFRASQEVAKNLELAADFVGGSHFLYPIYGSAFRFDGPRQLGLSANYAIPLTDRVGMRLYTRVWNTLGQNYFEDGFQTPGRWAVGGIRLSF
jgi:vitamin B12 transporter